MNTNERNELKIYNNILDIIPSEMSLIMQLAKIVFDLLANKDDDLCVLYKKAIKKALNETNEIVRTDSEEKLFKKLADIDCYNNFEELYEYFNVVYKQASSNINKKDLHIILNSISDNFNNILLEDEYTKLYKCILLNRQIETCGLNENIDELRKKLCNMVDNFNKMKIDNQSYSNNFIKPLFMHKRDIKITLQDVFVLPDVIVRSNESKQDILYAVCKFIESNNSDVLFIEGWGGYGKSSFVSFLSYYYDFNRANNKISFLSNRQFIIIRLRDIRNNNIIKEINDKIIDSNNLEHNAVIIFDGLDELCMSGNFSGTSIAKDIMKQFAYYPRKIIITTRQTYVDYGQIDKLQMFYDVVEIQSFDNCQRKNFVNLFSKKDNRHTDAINYIKDLPYEKQNNSSIYGSPFLLYLILSGGIEEQEKNNSWLLMHRLFHNELFDPSYESNRGMRNDLSERIYQLNCDIAFEMFKTKNRKLSISSNKIIQLLSDSSDYFKEIIKESHGLFTYMRKDSSGAVEFVHNHVRDYFLCEKILLELKKLYSTSELDYSQIAIKISQLLMYDEFTSEVKTFLFEALNTDEYETLLETITNEPMYHIFDYYYISGGLPEYNNFYSSVDDYNTLSNNFLKNFAYLYQQIYLKNKRADIINWISNKNARNYYRITAIETVKKFLSCAFLFNISLENADLSGANLKHSILCKANLSNTNLKNADLSHADLREINLQNADLDDTDFSCANLCGADLSNAKNINTAHFYNSKYDEKTTFPSDFIKVKQQIDSVTNHSNYNYDNYYQLMY